MRMRERPWTCVAARPRRVADEPHLLVKEDGEFGLFHTSQEQQRPQLLNRREHQRHKGCQLSFSETDGEFENLLLTPRRYNRINNRNISPKADRRVCYRTFANGSSVGKSGRCGSSLFYRDSRKGTSLLTVSRKLLHQNSVSYRPVSVMTRNNTTLLSSRNKERNSKDSSCASPGLKDSRYSLNSKNCGLYLHNAETANRKIIPNDEVKICERNYYRNINETIFELRFDNVHQDAGSVVTFNLADGERKSTVCSQYSSDEASCRGMSAIDLPPIISREDKRKISTNSVTSTENKTSLIQQSSPVNKLNNNSRRSSTDTSESFLEETVSMAGGLLNKKKFLDCRNFSDSSLVNLKANCSNQSKGSGSTITSYGALQTRDVSDGRVDAKYRNFTEYKTLTNGHKARSLGATDTSDSQVRFETLFEGQNYGSGKLNNNNISINVNKNSENKNTFNQRVITNKGISSKNVIRNVSYNNRTTNKDTISMPSVARPTTSMSVSGTRNVEGVSRHLKTLNRNFVKGNLDDAKIDKVYGSVTKGRMVRSNSENKLNGQSIHNGAGNKPHVSNGRQTRQTSMSRHLSVDIPEKQRSSSQQRIRGVTSSRPRQSGGIFKIRKFNSVSNMYNGDASESNNDFDVQEEMYYTDDSVDTSSRLVEWLHVVNNVDRYDTDPRDEVIEYCDEPPQTDTAIHVVYEGD